jgi:hypothetical protein
MAVTSFPLTSRRRVAVPRLLLSSSSSLSAWVSDLVGRGSVVINGVEVATLPGGLRGIVATTNVASNAVTVSVPAALALETNNNRPPSPFPTFCSEAFWSKQAKWDHRLCFKLLHEVKGLGGGGEAGSSATAAATATADLRKAWIQQLPANFSTPLHWSDDQVAALQYPALTHKVAKQRNEWRAFYDEWRADGGGSGVLFEEFVWALECVNSRAFSGIYEGSTASERRALLLFTGLLTVAWPLLGLGSPEQTLLAAAFVGVSVVTKDFFFSQAAGLKRYVVCPYIDMFNRTFPFSAPQLFLALRFPLPSWCPRRLFPPDATQTSPRARPTCPTVTSPTGLN